MQNSLLIGIMVALFTGCATNPFASDKTMHPTEEATPGITYVDRYVSECPRVVQQVQQLSNCENCRGFSVTAMTNEKRCKK